MAEDVGLRERSQSLLQGVLFSHGFHGLVVFVSIGVVLRFLLEPVGPTEVATIVAGGPLLSGQDTYLPGCYQISVLARIGGDA